jgi:hypothetical protein
MDITQDLVEYINNVISSAVKGCDYEVALYAGNLYIFADKSILYKIDISEMTGIELLYGIKRFESEVTYLSQMQFNNILYRYNTIKSFVMPMNLLTENIEVRSDPLFNEYNSMKATDGMGFMKVPIVYYGESKVLNVPVFPGLPQLNKADTVAMQIYPSNIPNEYIIRYDVYKKKLKKNIEILFKILDINRPIRSF